MIKAARRIGPLTWIGVFLVLGAVLFSAELVAEQTIVTWTQGMQMVGFYLAHSIWGPLGALFICLAGIWVAVFLVIAAIRRSIGTRVNLVLVAVFAISVGALFIPYGSWILAMAFLTGGHARTEWLIFAAATGDERLASYMLAKGVDVNAQGSRGQSALAAAASGGEMEVARMLLSKGARTDSRTSVLGETPLTEAAQMGHLDMVKLLIEFGADPNERETDGCKCNALDWAIKNGNEEMADFLRSQMK